MWLDMQSTKQSVNLSLKKKCPGHIGSFTVTNRRTSRTVSLQKASSHLHCSAGGLSTGPHWVASTARPPPPPVRRADSPVPKTETDTFLMGQVITAYLRDGTISRSKLSALFSSIVSAAFVRAVQCACHPLIFRHRGLIPNERELVHSNPVMCFSGALWDSSWEY